jgi:hypothetical protein
MIAEKLDPVTRSRAQRFFPLTVFLLLLLALGGYFRLRRSPIDGTWVKLEGMTDELPHEMTVRLTNTHFIMRYWDAGGVEQITMLLDGKEHLLRKIPGLNTTESYTARLEGKTLLITKHLKMSSEDVMFTRHWVLGTDGRLRVSDPDHVSTFRRKPLLRYLFAGTP